MHRKFSKRRSRTMKALWKDSDYRKKVIKNRSEGLKRSWNDKRKKAHGKAHSKIMKALWANPVFRKKMEKKRKEQVTPKERKRLRGMVNSNWANKKIRNKLLKHLTSLAQDETRQNDNSLQMKELWKDKDYRNKQMKTRNKTMYYKGSQWHKNIARRNRETKTGIPSWNSGLTKNTHTSLMSASKKLLGRMPDYNKYKCWYPNNNDKQIEMRSSWEVSFALWLDMGGIKWKYESQFFYVGKGYKKWKGMTYTPDFYLPEQNVYIELKGRLSKQNQNKLDRFKSLYPDTQLWIFRKQHLGKVLEFAPRKRAA